MNVEFELEIADEPALPFAFGEHVPARDPRWVAWSARTLRFLREAGHAGRSWRELEAFAETRANPSRISNELAWLEIQGLAWTRGRDVELRWVAARVTS